jgi:uncharacterized membrane protein (UPF0127 family)
MKRFLLLVSLLLASNVHAQTFQTTSLTIGVYLIRAEMAISDEERSRGLMFREKLGQNDGMVFRFVNNGRACMWMKNTPLPLSVAFIAEDGRIVNIEDMAPQTLQPHCAQQPVRYALEMNQGWFSKRNIKPGALVSGLPK